MEYLVMSLSALLLPIHGLHSVPALVFYASLALLIYTYAGYPVLLAVIALFIRRKQVPLGYEPFLSILICAYNEQSGIRKKIQDTLNLNYSPEKMEILVVSDGSNDATESIVQSFSDPRVRLLRTSSRKGKTNAQNEGVPLCTGEVIVFSDATTVYHPDALRHLAANYLNPRVGAVSGRYEYFDERGTSPTGTGTITFWNYENCIKQLQSQIRTITGCCGCIYSVRKSAYTMLPADIISDLVQPLRAIQKGYRVVFEPRALAYESTTETSKQEFRMRVRVITRAMRGILNVRSLLNPFIYGWISFQLLSHKVLRWLAPFYLAGIFVASAALIERPIFRLSFSLQAVFYLSAVFSLLIPLHRFWKLLGIPLYFCTLNAAAAVSLLELVRGRKYVVWETVR